MNDEREQFQEDLLTSVRQMRAGKVARPTRVILTAVAEALTKVGLSQNDFAKLVG